MDLEEAQVAVIGGGVVGCAVAHALARRGVRPLLLEAECGLALGASGSNSGILHSGFDAPPGALETKLILRSAQLRAELQDELRVPVWRCGAELRPRDARERAASRLLAENARANGVAVRIDGHGALTVAEEAVTDPVAFVLALARAAQVGGAQVRLRARVSRLARAAGGGLELGLEDGRSLRAGAAVNCAGLHADEVARLGGDEIVSLYPRKGEFLVFAALPQAPLARILLPVPSAAGKGVLVFPTTDGQVIAGPTAREREDKFDWTVEADAPEQILARARRMFPALERADPIGAYAGLRPAGRDANYVIERSPTIPALIHVAAIRSTGLSASLGIGECVAQMLADAGAVKLARARPLPAPPATPSAGAWWERARRHHTGPAQPGAAA